ncbi:MAG: DedA family protein [Candidatus Jorgensenbacteria bacterium]
MIALTSPSGILLLLTTYGYAVFLLLATAEGPIATVIAGFLASLGYFNAVIVYFVAVAGDLIGDILYYAAGRWGGNRIVARGHFFNIKAERLETLERHFETHAGKTLLFGKWTQSIGAPILLAAGMARVPFKKYLWFNMLGTLPKVLILVLIGYHFGRAYEQIDKYLGYAVTSIFIVVVLAVAAYCSVKYFRKKSDLS